MEAEVSEFTGLPKGERDPERRLTERALLAVVQEAYVLGVSTRRRQIRSTNPQERLNKEIKRPALLMAS